MLYLSSLGLAVLSATVALTGSSYLAHTQTPNSLSIDQHGNHHHSGEHYSSPGKPGTAIAHLDNSHFGGLFGETLQLSLALQSPLHEGELRVEVSADPTLEVTLPDSAWQFSLHQPIPQIALAVAANEPGAHYVHLTVQHWLDGNLTQARALAVEVNFNSDTSAKLYEKSYKFADTPTVISLPAVETIR